MGRINNSVKWLVMNINFLWSNIGLCLIGLAIFALVSDWGSLDKYFFITWGTIGILFGSIVMLISILGCMGVTHQARREGLWTGRRILYLYQLTIIGTCAALFLSISSINNITASLETSLNSMDDPVPATYSYIENALSSKFNEFFDAAMTGCTSPKYVFFWVFVDAHCPNSISMQNCNSCDDYYIIQCQADLNTCESGEMYACAYDICREGVLRAIIKMLKPATTYIVLFTCFSGLLWLLVCTLICFTEKDSMEEMLIKAGTLNAPQKPRNQKISKQEDKALSEALQASIADLEAGKGAKPSRPDPKEQQALERAMA